MMKITEQWITQAAASLLQVGIVVRQEEEGRPAYLFPKPFKGYISSFAATVVQSGLLPTLDIYEKEDSAAEASRHLLPQAIAELLCRMGAVERREGCRLSDYWEQAAQADKEKKFREHVEKALVALKLAIRMYKAVKPEKCPSGTAGCSHAEQVQERVPKVEYLQQVPRAWNGPANLHANVGWLYYREYYRNYAVHRRTVMKYPVRRGGRDIEEKINKHEYLLKYRKNPYLLSSRLDKMVKANRKLSENLTEAGFASLTFRTLYPGLIIGLGLSHGTPAKGDLKCGFQFDYATGLPIIPGSSVKGVLRSVFPDPDSKEEDEKNRQKAEYIARLLGKQGIGLRAESRFRTVQQLAKQIFEYDDTHRVGTDVFMDAILTGPSEGEFLAEDYLTPHGDGYKDPVPIQFLKVLPNIEFTFFFKLTVFKIGEKEVDKLDLFRSILEDVGIGAKTNVGYGHLKAIK